MSSKILICGDSFSADWMKKTGNKGWPNLLADENHVVNLSQAGCGQYKIYKQLKKYDLAKFDCVIVSHTSPYRIHVNQHPIHHGDLLHHSCDLIYEDLTSHAGKSDEIRFFVDFFEKYFDLEHAVYIHGLICRDIESYLTAYNGKVIHIRNIPWDGFYCFPDMLDNSDVFFSHRGNSNHFSDEGNMIVYDRVIERISA
jgi:hypothetical protein